MTMRNLLCLTVFAVAFALAASPAVAEPTFAERLGWPADAKVVIFHIDDTGMSHSSNAGTIKAMEEGLATSCSIMMPCPWVPEYVKHLEAHPDTDAGLHLTLTSEWDNYRWYPVAGIGTVPGLVDPDGCMWGDVIQVVTHATPDEVEAEIRAQVDRALMMGIKPTHLDSHMGTLFATPAYTERYIKVGVEKRIPVLFPGGHLQYVGQELPVPAEKIRETAMQIWNAGLPVVDDILSETYGWKRGDKVARFSQVMREMKPGVLEIILHCTEPSEVFPLISTSAETRKGDLEAMLSDDLRKVIETEGVILTTWRELMERREKVQ